MLRSGLILTLAIATLCGCAQPPQQRPYMGPPAPNAPSPDRVTPPPPPIDVIRPRV
ncbi:hypothetical protein [Caulobacter henricii]|uniref:hypothetical protein n=1 Tax=Caulobacter henricii TaxID=69395 RepID=UPI000A88D817|nr:hypothetical protein [Caulobacter henricii]